MITNPYNILRQITNLPQLRTSAATGGKKIGEKGFHTKKKKRCPSRRVMLDNVPKQQNIRAMMLVRLYVGVGCYIAIILSNFVSVNVSHIAKRMGL